MTTSRHGIEVDQRIPRMHLPELDFAPGVAAALTDTTREQAEELLEALVDTHLVEAAPAPGRYRFHDLLRLYARERVQTDETDLDRDAAQRRMLTWYLDNVTAAVQVLTPGRRDLLRERAGDWPEPVSSTPAQAVAWFEAEWANLVAATHQTAACGLHEIAWPIPDALYSFASLRRQWMDWRNACLVGRAAAQQGLRPPSRSMDADGHGSRLPSSAALRR